MGHRVHAKKPKKKAPVTRVIEAKKVAKAATARAERVHSNALINRSTRTRTAYKIRSEALDRVIEILEG